jgi:hypothetical protein
MRVAARSARLAAPETTDHRCAPRAPLAFSHRGAFTLTRADGAWFFVALLIGTACSFVLARFM